MKYQANTDIIGATIIESGSETNTAALKEAGLTDERIAVFVERNVLTVLGEEEIVAEEVAPAKAGKKGASAEEVAPAGV